MQNAFFLLPGCRNGCNTHRAGDGKAGPLVQVGPASGGARPETDKKGPETATNLAGGWFRGGRNVHLHAPPLARGPPRSLQQRRKLGADVHHPGVGVGRLVDRMQLPIPFFSSPSSGTSSGAEWGAGATDSGWRGRVWLRFRFSPTATSVG